MKRFRITTTENHPFMDGWTPCYIKDIQIGDNDDVDIHSVTGQIIITKLGSRQEIIAIFPNTVIFEQLKNEE